MNTRRLQGVALIVTAVVGLLGMVWQGGTTLRVVFILGGLLFIFGVPAIEAIQRSGMLGTIGTVLLLVGAAIAVVVNGMLISGATDVGDALPLAGAVASGAGSVIIGWLTAQKKVFAAWIGWAFLLAGLLNFITGLIISGASVPLVVYGVTVLGAAADIGYGLSIIQHAQQEAAM